MIWTHKPDRWRKRFALLPLTVIGYPTRTVWLEWYWARPGGDCTEVRLTDPLRDHQTAEKSLGITKSIIPNGLGDVKL